MTKRRVIKHAILMATALFLTASGSAYAFCWHMGRQIVCPPGVPDGSNSMYFDASGNAVFPGPGGTTVAVPSGSLVAYTPPPTWTPAPTPAPAPPQPAPNVSAEGKARELLDGPFMQFVYYAFNPVVDVQRERDINDVERRNRLMHEQFERNERLKRMAEEQERQDKEREKRFAKEKADEKERLKKEDRKFSRLEIQRNREDQAGKGLRDVDLANLGDHFYHDLDYLGDRSEYAGSGRGEGYGFSIGGREGQGQFAPNANYTPPASPISAGIQASDAANSSVPGAIM